MAKPKRRTERLEIRLSPSEKEILLQAADQKGMTLADFIRFVSVEMGRSIVQKPDEPLHAVLMGVGSVPPEVVLYSASADFSPSPSPPPDEEED